MILMIFDIIGFLILLIIISTQIIYPMFSTSEFFWFFRKRESLKQKESALTEVLQKEAETEVDKEIKNVKERMRREK